MKVFVTGGAGYIGTVLTQLLLERGDSVCCFDNLTFGIDPLLPFFRNPRYELVRGDVRDRAALQSALHDADVVIHLAAIVGFPACDRAPDLAQQINANGTRILSEARSRSQPIIAASTGSVYGAVEHDVCTEETPLNPLTVYGKTKAEAEQILLGSGQVVCLRFATAFGLGPRLRLDLLVNDFCFQALQKRSLILYEPHFMRSFIHVHDIARAFIHTLDQYDAMLDQVFNCGNQALNVSKLELARIIQKHASYYLHVAEIGRDQDGRNYEMSYEKIESTGFGTTVTLDEGVLELLAALRHLRLPNPYGNEGGYH